MRNTQVPSNDRFKNSLPIAAILDEWLATQRDHVGAWVGSRADDGREPTFHMSGGICLRKEVMQKQRAPQTPMNGMSLRRFAMGNLVEAVLDKAVEWKGISVAKQLKVWRDWGFRAGKGHRETYEGVKVGQPPRLVLEDCLAVGRIDHIVRWDGKVILIDWKSVNPKKFGYLDWFGDESSMIQVASYISTVEEQYAMKIDFGRLVYFDRANGRLKQLHVDRDTWVPKAWARWKAERSAWETFKESSEVPAELPFAKDKPTWSCTPEFCGYAVAKWGNGSYVCPAVAAYWEGGVSKNGNGKASAFVAAALKLGANTAPKNGNGESRDLVASGSGGSRK